MVTKKTSAKKSINLNGAHGESTPTYNNGNQIKKSLLRETPAIYQALYISKYAILNNSKKGLEAKAAVDFINLSGFSSAQFQETFKTTLKTIQNYKRDGLKLDAVLSEKLLKSFALFEIGIAVFGSSHDFNDWLHLPAFGLGNQVPVNIMDTITGISLIEDELTRIAYGDLA